MIIYITFEAPEAASSLMNDLLWCRIGAKLHCRQMEASGFEESAGPSLLEKRNPTVRAQPEMSPFSIPKKKNLAPMLPSVHRSNGATSPRAFHQIACSFLWSLSTTIFTFSVALPKTWPERWPEKVIAGLVLILTPAVPSCS